MSARLPSVRVKRATPEEFKVMSHCEFPEWSVSDWYAVVDPEKDIAEGSIMSWFRDFDGDVYELYMPADGGVTEMRVEGTNFLELSSGGLFVLARHVARGERLAERMFERWRVLYHRGVIAG